MPNRSAEEARALSDDDLHKRVDEAYRDLFNLRFRHANRNLADPNQLRAARRRIARLRTIERERQIESLTPSAVAVPPAPAAAPVAAPAPRRSRRATRDTGTVTEAPIAATSDVIEAAPEATAEAAPEVRAEVSPETTTEVPPEATAEVAPEAAEAKAAPTRRGRKKGQES